MSSPTQQDEERMLFAIMLECLCQQTEILPFQEKQRAKQWLSAFLPMARSTSEELKKNMSPDTRALFENMYDYVYMTVRDAAQVDAADVDEFRKLVSDFVKKKNEERRVSIFKVN